MVDSIQETGLSPGVVDDYLFRDFGGDFSSALLATSRRSNARSLLNMANEGSQLLDDEGRGRLSRSHAILAGVRNETLAQLAAEPVAYHWVCIARMFLKQAQGLPKDPILDAYEREFALQTPAFRRRHLLDHLRFAFGAMVLEAMQGIRCEFDLPLEEPFSWVIPGTPSRLVPPSGKSSIRRLTRDCVSKLASGRAGSIRLDESSWTIERLLGGSQRVPFLLDSSDACMRLSFVESYKRVDCREALSSFENVLGEAIQCLHRFNADLTDEMSHFTRRVCPMDTSARAEMSSGSVSSMFGATFMSVVQDPTFAAEMLLHEFGHNKLRLLDDAFPLLQGDDSNSYYSPWRNEPRPLDGIMHGLYVFSLVANFWLWVYRNATTRELSLVAERRVRTLIPQLDFARDEFDTHARCTRDGEIYRSVVSQAISDLIADAPSGPFSLPAFLVGPVADTTLLGMPTAAAVERHRELFHERYGGMRHV